MQAQKRKMSALQHGKNLATAGDEGTAEYCPENSCRIAAALARLGNATDADIAETLGISMPEFRSWRRKHPEFSQAVKTPPSFSDAALERAVLRHALGYSYTTEKLISTREGAAVRSVTIHVPPSVDSLEFLLRARMPRVYGAKVAKNPLERWLENLDKRKPPASAVVTEELLDDEICRVAHVTARLWASDKEIAEALGISLDRFNELRDRHVELAEALKSGKEFIDAALERALTQRAFGYEYVGEEIFCSREGDVMRKRIPKHVPPDLKALDLWSRAHPAS